MAVDTLLSLLSAFCAADHVDHPPLCVSNMHVVACGVHMRIYTLDHEQNKSFMRERKKTVTACLVGLDTKCDTQQMEFLMKMAAANLQNVVFWGKIIISLSSLLSIYVGLAMCIAVGPTL